MKTLLLYLTLTVSALAWPVSMVFTLTNPEAQAVGPVQIRLLEQYIEEGDFVDGVSRTVTIPQGSTAIIRIQSPTYRETALVKMQVWNSSGITIVGNSYVGGASSTFQDSGSSWFQENEPEMNIGPIDVSDLGIYTSNFLPTANDSKTLWMVEDEDLNADVFREGADKIVAAINNNKPSSGGGGMTKAEFQSTKTDQLNQLAESLTDEAQDITNNAATVAATKKTESEASLTQALPTIPIPAASTEKNILEFTIPGIGVHVNLDPAGDSAIMVFCYYVNLLGGWGMIISYTIWVWDYFLKVLGIGLTAQQAKGNTVAGTGGQVTAFIAAGIMTVAFLALPAAYWTIAHYDFSPLEAASPFDASGKGSIVGAALYLLGLIFPFSLAITLLGLSLVVRKLGATLVLGVHAYVRFVTT